ncbi:MAG: PEP-CTERM sorting domain-containing protein [Verrucomicrobiota bacterium]|nr:PEP-CTERM sorting domain-containing protein [Verrucomicrobiota bacterium]
MKKVITASVLGMGASLAMVIPSYGQGTVFFGNYAPGSGVNAPVTFAVAGTANGNAVTAGEAVGSEFMAGLLYSLDGGTTWKTDTAANSGAYPAPFYSTDGNAGGGAGYFGIGSTVTLPSWTSGSVEFIVQAWFGGATYAASQSNPAGWFGASAPVTVPGTSIGSGTTPPGYLTGLSGFTVSPVPEPTSLALAGLGGLSLLAFRRRKA